MTILIKCNQSDLVQGDIQTFVLRKQKGIGVARGQEAFVWVSENPREGRPELSGLLMRGEVIDWEPERSAIRVVVHITAQLNTPLGMNALGQINSDPARELHRRIRSYRHPYIWGVPASQREVLYTAFQE